ncbi:MAG: Got1/Sft2-like family vesicle transport protein [archaeon]|nr:Got1/Sft2-like family vesicle transport protein [archaeon]
MEEHSHNPNNGTGYDTITEEVSIDKESRNENNKSFIENDSVYGQSMASSEETARLTNSTSDMLTNNSFVSGIQRTFSETSKKAASYAMRYVDKLNIEPSFKFFSIFLIIGIGFLFVTVLSLPFLLLSPARFILSLSVGNLLVLVSFLFYYGSKEYFQIIFNESRIWLSISFLVSILCGVLTAFYKIYLLSLIFSVFEIIAFIMFLLSFIPGGRGGIEFFKSFFINTFFGIFGGIKEKFFKSSSELPQ